MHLNANASLKPPRFTHPELPGKTYNTEEAMLGRICSATREGASRERGMDRER